jgi:hypothetical protein
VQSGGAQAGGPRGTNPGADKAAREQVDRDRLLRGERRVGDHDESGRQRVRTTARLIALLTMTVCRVTNPNRPISRGSRNSAPPSPIMPPRTQTAVPAENAAIRDRRPIWHPRWLTLLLSSVAIVRCCQALRELFSVNLRQAWSSWP